MRLYLAGPMRGYPRFNFDLFERVTKALRALGHDVISPHEHDVNRGIDPDRPESLKDVDWGRVMREDVLLVLSCDVIALLPGWERSRGACFERIVAESCGKHSIEVMVYKDTHILRPMPRWDHPAIFSHGREMTNLTEAGLDVLRERHEQDKKWGEQNHSFEDWLPILTEEVGEACRARMESRYRGGPKGLIRNELTQVAAVALAMLECGDRNEWFDE